MVWTELHGRLCSGAFEKVLGRAEPGAMAFVRCLSPEVAERLGRDRTFAPTGWRVFRVADADDPDARTITADRAVELRETKGDPVLLVVDTARAGAGMDGIYSAAQEVQESQLLSHARSLAASELVKALTREARDRAEQALKRARRASRRINISYWAEFDFLVRVAAARRDPGELLYLLGLWPVKGEPASDWSHTLDLSWLFVERLLGAAVAGLTPAQRIESLKLLAPSDKQRADLERFVRSAATKPILLALEELADKEHLWINALRTEATAQEIQSIEIVPWRTNTDQITRWSGLVEGEDPDQPPVLILKADAERTGDYSKLEVRWKVRPDNLERGAVTYRVAIVTDMDEELAVREVPHAGKKEEKCRFANDDFSMLNDDALISAKLIVSVIGSDVVEPQETEEFTIRFGEPPDRLRGGGGKEVRTFSEGLIELSDREAVSELTSDPSAFREDPRGFVLLRTKDRGKSFRVFRPALIREVEQQWAAQPGSIGRWRVKVRTSGARVGEPEFVPFARDAASADMQPPWDRVANASRRMAERFAQSGGGVGQVYDGSSKAFETVVKEYLLAWAALLEEGDPLLALAHTVEVRTLSGRTVGLIVLPSHPLRVAWHVAYDSLVLHTAFEYGAAPKHVREEFKILDGSLFPAFLPGLQQGSSFVYADTLRFHAVGLVGDDDKEPKAAIAMLARALGEAEAADAAPTVGRQSAEVLGNEIQRYIECHDSVRLLHIHALRPGDGLTIARALGKAQDRYMQSSADEDPDDGASGRAPSFVLELYPSREQRAVAGRFIAEAREKRRRGAGVLAPEDHWMLDSVGLPGGMTMPRLRWARKGTQDPTTAAHLAVAFDTFESKVVPDDCPESTKPRPYFAYGLLSFFERHYTDQPSPCWRSTVLLPSEGEKHPSDRTHSERLIRLQQAILRCVARNIAAADAPPTLHTEISPEKAHGLRELHRLCDWVITLDRNAGIEYFDSPRTNREIYDAYVIDCVPEREDLGCLQLITSTSNLEEVRNLLDGALDQMGLSQSRRNAEFLMDQLKALSGRLAIQLTGQKIPTAELIALALSHANCERAAESDPCWTPLQTGFFIPVDDVLDLMPPLSETKSEDAGTEVRPDLIYVSLTPRRGLRFQFIEVKYRRHLRTARSVELLDGIRRQITSLRERWEAWYSTDGVPPSFRAVRRAKLARVLRFYADKAQRHHLRKERYDGLVAEIDRMVEKGGDYAFGTTEAPDRGWVFCPEYGGIAPLEISTGDWDTRIFLFGPGLLPDSDFRRETIGQLFPVPPRPDDGDPTTYATLPDAPREESRAPALSTPTGEETSRSDTPGSATGPDPAFPAVVMGTDSLTGTDVRWPLTIKGNPHLLVAGLPGMGKTTCLLNLCHQMLAAGVRPIVFSYHEDIDQRLQELVGSVRFVDFQGLGFNPLQVIDRGSRMAYLDVAGALRDIFVAIYPELGDIQGERIRRAIKESFLEQGWGDPAADVAALPEPLFTRFVDILRSDPRPDRGLHTLLGRLEELADYGFFELADSRESLWESDQPTVIRIHATQNDNLQKAFASLVFYGLYKDMFRRGIQSRITHAVIFDEAHRAARLRLIPTMAKECRKYGVSLVLASQEAKDFNASLFSAIANYLVLRLNETDAKALVRNVASSDQERALIDKIKQMDRFKALYFCEGRRRPSFVLLRSL
ncbi:ATP-binding protein [Kallotenue papyrolyticum]|uniref:ATP-binding protein n=1 Tax=Kallotenue papyrolyticum TaxID=1325125 RepID=UPI0004AF83C0|nr:ATP-binding protein [Kallotenue papyrolyticum]